MRLSVRPSVIPDFIACTAVKDNIANALAAFRLYHSVCECRA